MYMKHTLPTQCDITYLTPSESTEIILSCFDKNTCFTWVIVAIYFLMLEDRMKSGLDKPAWLTTDATES